jgi:signal peptidase I
MTEKRGRRTLLRDYYESLLIAFVIVNFARVFVFQAFKIPSGSMLETLLVGDHIIVNKFVYGVGSEHQALAPLRTVRRGDVVVFRFPKKPTLDYVKRVVAVPGDELKIRDKRVYVNGRAVEEPYKIHQDELIYPDQPALPEPWRSRDQFGPVRIPEGEYFVLGDNRDQSNDSRYWGTVPRELIRGRAFIVYWSFGGLSVPAGSPARDRFRELGSVLAHFFSKTRWERTFRVIDSGYHYQDQGSPTG